MLARIVDVDAIDEASGVVGAAVNALTILVDGNGMVLRVEYATGPTESELVGDLRDVVCRASGLGSPVVMTEVIGSIGGVTEYDDCGIRVMSMSDDTGLALAAGPYLYRDASQSAVGRAGA